MCNQIIPEPNWDEAPEWSNWWAMDKDGDAYWYEAEPFIESDKSWNNEKFTKYSHAGEACVNGWQLTLQRRVVASEATGGDTDGI